MHWAVFFSGGGGHRVCLRAVRVSSLSARTPTKTFEETAMPESKKAASKSAASAKTPDAIELLTAEHKEVNAMFKEYQKLVDGDKSSEEKEALARQICLMLTVHATTEEEIFYPAARDAIDDEDLLDEAEVEHGSAKELIAQIEAGSPSDPLYDAKVKVLGEYVQHHVKEEEEELFPKVKKAKVDLAGLGQQILVRKEELMPEMAAE
jgi:hemerythrin superfamily protein